MALISLLIEVGFHRVDFISDSVAGDVKHSWLFLSELLECLLRRHLALKHDSLVTIFKSFFDCLLLLLEIEGGWNLKSLSPPLMIKVFIHIWRGV